VVATGETFVVVGAPAELSCVPELALLDVPAAEAEALVWAEALWLARVTAKAPAPTTPAAPAPKVMADTKARPLLRASCRPAPEVGELFIVLHSGIGGRGLLRCSWSMALGSNITLCWPWALPLNCL
jgi:hypothetical protein